LAGILSGVSVTPSAQIVNAIRVGGGGSGGVAVKCGGNGRGLRSIMLFSAIFERKWRHWRQ